MRARTTSVRGRRRRLGRMLAVGLFALTACEDFDPPRPSTTTPPSTDATADADGADAGSEGE